MFILKFYCFIKNEFQKLALSEFIVYWSSIFISKSCNVFFIDFHLFLLWTFPSETSLVIESPTTEERPRFLLLLCFHFGLLWWSSSLKTKRSPKQSKRGWRGMLGNLPAEFLKTKPRQMPGACLDFWVLIFRNFLVKLLTQSSRQ